MDVERLDIDRAAVLALNNDHETETSRLDAAGLEELLRAAFFVGLRNRGADAFLIAMDQGSEYDSPNFLWFKARHGRFAYVDRVIVSPSVRGRGQARGLYEDLFAAARASGYGLVCCEVNLDPPNPGSMAFHRSLGFEEVGSGFAGEKRVAYLRRMLGG